jgi:hypothetical protein
MRGKPAGAAQSRIVASELRCYERVAGVRFIEQGYPHADPRSAAYRPADGGGQLRLRFNEPECHDEELDEAAARAYIEALDAHGAFDLDRVYRPVQGSFSLSPQEWRLEVEFTANADGTVPEPYVAEGENAWPDGYEELVLSLQNSL